jgi:hypothetical protein
LYEGQFIMALSTASGPWRSTAGFIVPITYIFATDIVGGEYQIQDAGARILVLSAADGGPAAEVTFILPEVTLPDGITAFVGPQSARPELNGIEGSITNYGGQAHKLKGFGSQVVSGVAEVTVGTGTVVQWAGNGNPNAPWLAISTAILAA